MLSTLYRGHWPLSWVNNFTPKMQYPVRNPLRQRKSIWILNEWRILPVLFLHVFIAFGLIFTMCEISQILSPSEILCSFPNPSRAYFWARHTHLELKAAQKINWTLHWREQIVTYSLLQYLLMQTTQTIQNKTIQGMDENEMKSPGI